MKRVIGLCLLPLVISAAGCVSSIHPLYDERDVIFDRALLGRWTEVGDNEFWEFTRGDANTYSLLHTDEKGKTGQFEAHLFKVGQNLFLDIVPSSPELSGTELYSDHFIAVHTFVHLSPHGESFQISYLDDDWLKPFLKKNPAAVRHVTVDGQVIFVDSSKNMQSFLLAHLRTPGAFSKPLTFGKKADPAVRQND